MTSVWAISTSAGLPKVTTGTLRAVDCISIPSTRWMKRGFLVVLKPRVLMTGKLKLVCMTTTPGRKESVWERRGVGESITMRPESWATCTGERMKASSMREAEITTSCPTISCSRSLISSGAF